MGAHIAKHNPKILRQSPPPTCNCQKKSQKRLFTPVACNQNWVVYQVTVANNKGEGKNFVGLAKNLGKGTENIMIA